MSDPNEDEIVLRACIGCLCVGVISFGGGAAISYIEAYLVGPPNWKFGRQGQFELGCYAAFCFSVMMVVCYAISCPVYLVLTRRPSPILLGISMPILLLILEKSGVLEYLMSWINYDFGPGTNGLPEIFASAFTCALFAAVFSIGVLLFFESLKRKFRMNRSSNSASTASGLTPDVQNAGSPQLKD